MLAVQAWTSQGPTGHLLVATGLDPPRVSPLIGADTVPPHEETMNRAPRKSENVRLVLFLSESVTCRRAGWSRCDCPRHLILYFK